MGKMHKHPILRGEIKSALKALGPIALFYVVLQCFGVTCPIKFLTGVSCPGCGMTRAWLSVFRLDFNAAWHYHPLFWSIPIILLVCYLRYKGRIPSKIYNILLCVAMIMFLSVYLLRLFSGNSDIVVFQPQNGAILRFLSFLK
ncbi:MAG: DUF2752 domain-containing protein [Bifidobacteriaceae bacterium]|nr:DUF2752 domain-containing protein [Bifidobacteriaceae bacterium]